MMEQVCPQCGEDDIVEDRKQGFLVCNVSTDHHACDASLVPAEHWQCLHALLMAMKPS
jgi:hypothetical protein